ncbi:serine/threonine-protein kinase nrc-2 [Pelomyxa schiedti]|nr:serine/threonine-protein kinase nrc-2 [Pelomyxa schiedti]
MSNHTHNNNVGVRHLALASSSSSVSPATTTTHTSSGAANGKGRDGDYGHHGAVVRGVSPSPSPSTSVAILSAAAHFYAISGGSTSTSTSTSASTSASSTSTSTSVTSASGGVSVKGTTSSSSAPPPQRERKHRRGSSDLNDRAAKPSSSHADSGHHIAETAHVSKAQVGREDFVIIRQLGKGHVGKVYLVRHKETNRLYAMKVYSKEAMIREGKIKRCQTEREILSQSNHPLVMTLYWSFQSPNCLYFVMEYCAGGEFFKTLSKQPNGCLSEEGAKFYGAEVLIALEYLHYMGFIYRDLKPENILLRASGHIVLTDFDLSKGAASSTMRIVDTWNTQVLSIKSELATRSFVGTEEYIAPEVIKGTVQTGAVDWWTFGILLYEMMFGITPFKGSTQIITFQNIMTGAIAFPDKPSVSKYAKDIIKKLLVREAPRRLGSENGADDLRNHPFFKAVKWQSTTPLLNSLLTIS